MRIGIKSFITKKQIAAIGLYLFVCNTLIVPILHTTGIFTTHCISCSTQHSDHQNKEDRHSPNNNHHPDNCIICKIIATATIAPHNNTYISKYTLIKESVILHKLTATYSQYYAKLNARAPPLFI